MGILFCLVPPLAGNLALYYINENSAEDVAVSKSALLVIMSKNRISDIP